MLKTLLTATAVFAILTFFACKKSSSVSNAKTVENLSGSYNLTALTWTTLGLSVNVYDSLPDCEKDNVVKLNTDLSLDFIDGVPVCTPNESDHGSWSLSSNGDTLYFGTTPSYIKSWDGKTLVLTGIVDDGPPQIIGQSTFVKK